MQRDNPFEEYGAEYDSWFDSPAGSEIFRRELDCLRQTVKPTAQRWLEVGCGSGRFAAALGITDGVDCSSTMAAIARTRGINIVIADGRKMPYSAESFDGVLLVCTICFLAEPEEVLRECCRCLKDDGKLVIGFIPANSTWGLYNAWKGRRGHHFYSHARFYVPEEINVLVEKAGFCLESSVGCRLLIPETDMEIYPVTNESFMVLNFRKGDIRK